MFATAEMIRQWNENGKAYFPTFATNADLSAAVAANGGQSLGPSVSVGATPETAVMWTWDGEQYVPVTWKRYFDTLADLQAKIPVGAFVGQRVRVKQLFGNDTFAMEWNGSRWAVGKGEVLLRLDSSHPMTNADGEIPYTAVGTVYIKLLEAVVGPYISDGETWAYRLSIRSGGTWTTGGTPVVRTTGSTTVIGLSSNLNSATTRSRRGGTVKRSGGNLRRTVQTDTFSVSAFSDVAISDWSAMSMEFGVIPGAINDTYVIEECYLFREA